MVIHPRKAIRALGFAESFRPSAKKSTLAGVVMRADLFVDGIVLGQTTVGGEDATSSLLRMYRRLKRPDINVILLSGCIISRYNVVDVDELARRSKLPVVCLTYKESRGLIEEAIRRRPIEDQRERIALYRKLGSPSTVALKTGKRVYVRAAGLTDEEAREVLDAFTFQGGVPEPVRLARLAARAASGAASRR